MLKAVREIWRIEGNGQITLKAYGDLLASSSGDEQRLNYLFLLGE